MCRQLENEIRFDGNIASREKKHKNKEWIYYKFKKLEFDFMMRCPLLVHASIMLQSVNVTVMIRVQVAASRDVLEEFALHAPLLMVASVIRKRVDFAIVVWVEDTTGLSIGQIERVTFAVYVPLLEIAAVHANSIHVAVVVRVERSAGGSIDQKCHRMKMGRCDCRHKFSGQE